MPDLSLEQQHDGAVCGLDEVGRGPLAGPVVAACVYIPDKISALPFIAELKDSKKLSKTKLARLYDEIKTHCIYAVCEISPEEIDQINILQASLKAMSLACTQVHNQAPLIHALVDGNRLPQNLPCPATAVVKGDNVSSSIAAASIIAKVSRDRIMSDLAQDHPYYGWESNAGYPSKAHKDGIEAHGITPHHRKSFAPVRAYLERTQTARTPQPDSLTDSKTSL